MATPMRTSSTPSTSSQAPRRVLSPDEWAERAIHSSLKRFRSHEAYEDLVQEAWLRIFAARRSIGEDDLAWGVYVKASLWAAYDYFRWYMPAKRSDYEQGLEYEIVRFDPSLECAVAGPMLDSEQILILVEDYRHEKEHARSHEQYRRSIRSDAKKHAAKSTRNLKTEDSRVALFRRCGYWDQDAYAFSDVLQTQRMGEE